jgi:hypothetical protein
MKRAADSKARAAAQTARRRDGRHCPVCVAVLPRLAGAQGGARRCAGCGARPVAGLRCAHCHQEAVWQAATSATSAACAGCGRHGSKVGMVAGHEWLSDEQE